MIDLVFYGFLVILFYILAKELWTRSSVAYKTAQKFPGPYLYPFLGNIPAVAFLDPEQTFEFARNEAKKYQTTYRYWMMGSIVLSLIKAKDVEYILSSSKHLDKSYTYEYLHPFLGQGLLTIEGSRWQTRRRILTPGFHFNILQDFQKVFIEESNALFELLKNEINTPGGTNLNPIICRFTLNNIAETAMGIKMSQLKESDEYRKNIYEIGKLVLFRMMRPWLYSHFVYELLGHRKYLDRFVKPAHEFTSGIIKQRRMLFYNKRNEFEDITGENIYVTKKRRHAMLDTLLAAESRGEIDAAGIQEEVDTFTFEGHDTTASGLLFCIFLLANHRDVQDNVLAEIRRVVGEKRFDDITMQDFGEMEYFNRVLKECLRIYPPVPFIARALGEDWSTQYGTVPQGSLIQIHVFDLHYDPEQFPDPEKFDPDRFLPENCEKRHPFAYVPFSAGPRNCIGQKFALLEIKTVIAGLLLNFELKAVTKPEDVVFVADLVLRPKYPIKVQFQLRKTV